MGRCVCSCRSRGELVLNGGMEDVFDDKSINWTFVNASGVSSVNNQGRVHSGNWAVNANGGQSLDLDDVSLVVL